MAGEPVVFTGGPIRLMDADVTGPPPPALLVEDGRVRAVGELTDVRASARTTPRTVDLGGRALLPGFVDAHAHTLLHATALDSADLSEARCLDDVVAALRTQAGRGRGAVRGYGYDQSRLSEQRHPEARDLDRVSSERPVWIQHASGHGYVVNSVVLRQAGIDANTATPEGGRIDRDPAGRPTGVVFDAACDLLTGPDGVKVTNHGPNFHLPMDDSEVDRLFGLGQRSLLAAGITAICDAQVTELEMAMYLRARDSGRLTMRAHLLALSSHLEPLRKLGLVSSLGDDRLRLQGVKLYADGSVIARTARLGTHTCCGAPSPDGYLYHEADELTQLITAAHDLGLRTATHAQGPEPIEIVLDAIERAQAARPRRLRHRIEHCGFPTEEQVARLAHLDVTPVPQPMQVHRYGDSLLEDFGALGGRFYPYGSFVRHDVPVVVSSDAPVTMPRPLLAAWAATTRLTADGQLADGEQAVDRPTALAGVTRTPATLLDRSDVGTLRIGSRADLVLVDTDPLDTALESLAAATVSETWVDGERVWTEEDAA